MLALAPVSVRPAVASDLAGAAALIARLNAHPSSQSLHCAAERAGDVRAVLRRSEDFPGGWDRHFVIAATSDGETAGLLGCQPSVDGAFGWLWGPWVDDPRRWRTVVPTSLLDALCALLPAKVGRLEAFLHVENTGAQQVLRSRGFAAGLVTHIYVSRPANPCDTPQILLPELGVAHEVAFRRLHAECFPGGASTSADELLAGRDDEHRIFAVAQGLRLLGYVCLSVNHAPLEGFIDYLAVRPSARREGIGATLLASARRWTFEERHLPQLALCVSDWRAGARRLYEQAGFRLAASGIAFRRRR